MSNDDYKQGYKDGWKDGYEQAKEDLDDGLRRYPLPLPKHCSVCGISFEGLSNYCCMRMDCPSKTISSLTSISDPGPIV